MRRLAPVVALLAAGLILTGCGSDDSTATPTPQQTSKAPEEITTDAATVASGLGTIKAVAANLVTSIDDTAKAATLVAQIEPAWAPVEGTVKANDPDTYIALEDAFAVLEDASANADATKAAAGSKSVADAIAAYLAKYPAS